MEKKEVYICVTLYHLYLTLLLICKRNTKDSCVILLNANDPQIYKQFCKLEKSLQTGGYRVSCRLRNKTKDIFGLEELENRKQYKWMVSMFGEDVDKKFVLFNFAWNLQYIYSTANLYFKKSKEAYFIEEGVLTAINPPQPKWKVIIKKLTGTVVDFYKEDKLKEICVQQANLYPKSWRLKLKTLDMGELVSSVDENTKKTIAAIFLGDCFDGKSITRDGNVGIVYTQPLSEDGFITEEQKIDYYQKIVKFYSQYGRPIIKLHPRDLTDYKFDDSYTILPAYFPSELLAFLNIRFKYAVGICTSAVPTTEAEFKINLNDKFLNDLVFELKPLQ